MSGIENLRERQEKRTARSHALEDDGLPAFGHEAEVDLRVALDALERLHQTAHHTLDEHDTLTDGVTDSMWYTLQEELASVASLLGIRSNDG